MDTPLGPARAHLDLPADDVLTVGRLVLGHGAGGGVEAHDLVAVTRAARRAGWAVARVEQPWRVAGKRVAAPPPRLDEGWLAVLAALAGGGAFAVELPLVVGGRSAGARVACRTARVLSADAVVCLAFPLHPPGRPERSRAAELSQAGGRPVLVVQGERDPFGGPDEVRQVAPQVVEVVALPGDHSLGKDPTPVAEAVTAFLARRARR